MTIEAASALTAARAVTVLDHVLGDRLVADHDDGQPDQAGRVRLIERRQAGRGVGRRRRSPGSGGVSVH
jgi:uncharacterized phage protein gp47/JayE